MGQEAKFDKKEPSIRQAESNDPSCLEWLRKCCCGSSERDAPADNHPPVSSNKLPQTTGSTMPQDKDKSFEPAKSSNGSTPGPKPDQEQAPAQAIHAKEKEGEHLTSRRSVKTGGELKPSDTGKTHGNGYDYDNVRGSAQATRSAQMIEKEREEKYPPSRGSFTHKDELQPADTGNVHDKGYGYSENSLVSPQATKANQMIKREREDGRSQPSHESAKPKGELKPADTIKIPNKGYEYDDTTASLQASKDVKNSKQQIESHQVSRQSKQQSESTHHQEASRPTKFG